MRTLVLTVIVLALCAAPAMAQSPRLVNPGHLLFVVSADHPQVTTYVLGWFAPGAATPTREENLGTGVPSGTNELTFTVNPHPLAFGQDYMVRVKARAGTIDGEWSSPSNPFDRAPGKSGDPLLSK